MNSSSSPSRRFGRSAPLKAAAFATSTLLVSQFAQAATAVWNSTGADFNTGANWTGGTGAGGIPGTGDYAQFANGVTVQPNLGSALTILGINFAATASGYDLTSASGNTVALTLTSTGTSSTAAVRSTAGAGLTNTIDAALVLGGNGAQSIDQSGGGTLVINGVISGNANLTGVSFITSSGGTMTLTGLNTFTANATIGSSLGITISTLGNAGSAGNLGAGTTINLGGSNAGVLKYTGAGETSNKVFNLSGTTLGAMIDTTGATGALVLTSDWTATGAGSKTLTLRGDNTANNVISGRIVDNSETNKTALTKSGTGTWTLSGANSYTGTTTVSAGTLFAANATGSATGTGAVTVNGGTLGGTGFIGGATTITGASGGLVAGGIGTIGTLTFDSTLNISGLTGTGQLKFDLGAVGSSDKIVLSSGALSIGTGLLNFNDFNFTALSGFGAGTYMLFDTSTSIVGTLGASLAGTINGLDAVLSLSGNDIILTVTGSTIPEPSAFALVSGLLALAGCAIRRARR